MESNRKEEASSNIPHMHLFMFLKRRFPNLKDADITDSIQRFGLDKTRCEVELTRRSQEQHRSYYSWNRSRTNSRGSSTGQNSPLSPSETHSQVSSPLQNGTTLPSPLSGQTKIAMNPTFSPDANRNLAEQFIDVGISAISSPPSGGTRVVYSGASCSQVSTTCSGNTSVQCSSPPLHHIGFIADASNGFLNDLKGEPNSAPVIPESREPVFDPVLAHHRRSSADTAKEHYKKQSPSTAYPSPPPRKYSSPSSLTKTTTSPPSTSCPSTTATSFSNSPTHGQGKNQSPHRPAQGTRHVTFLHFIPSLPHGAHHNPVPPSENDTMCVGGRSYTSVNLQLRQPSADLQPPVNIRSNGSSLSYSTSSLDHKQGSRSSLQISIGPTGGSISAMRTNLKTDKHANTAFHIQYSSSDHKDSKPPSPSSTEAFPCSSPHDQRGNHDSQTKASMPSPQNKFHPQSWFHGTTQCEESISTPRPLRRTSLPETTGPPPFQHLHYPPSALTPEGDSPSSSISQHHPMVSSDWTLDPLFLEAAIQEQLARKERLKEELDQRIEDKTRLKNEIKGLSEKLDSKEKSQRLEVIRSKKEIELIQQDNSKLQFVCDEMERLILESGESPKTDQEGRLLNDLTSPTFQDSSRIHALPPLHSAGSNTSLSSGGRPMTPTPSLIPSRKAPSPPISAAVSPPTTSQNFRTSGNEEGGKGWSCSKCTFLNNPYLNECEICSFPHFSSGTPHLPNQNPSSAAPNSGGPCYCHHRHHYNLSHEHTSTVQPPP